MIKKSKEIKNAWTTAQEELEEWQQRMYERKRERLFIEIEKSENNQEAELENWIERIRTPMVNRSSPKQSRYQKHRDMVVEVNTKGIIDEDRSVRIIQ